MASRPDPELRGHRADWQVWGTGASLVVDDADRLPAAVELAARLLADVTAACSRFDDTSELSRLSRDPATATGVDISPLLAELIGAALFVAEQTGGSVDPTLGADLAAWGYDRDFASLPPAPRGTPVDVGGVGASTAAVPREPGWRRVRLVGRHLTVPAGMVLDLGATAKAYTCDLIARRIADTLGTGVLVSLGGDIASAGTAGTGWEVLVRDRDEDPAQQVFLPAGVCLATSSTQKRRWMRDGRPVQHILDPGFGTPVVPAWRSVSVAATTCLRANALSTAAIVRGRSAGRWLVDQGADARLVDLAGRVVTVGAWPDPDEEEPVAASAVTREALR